MADEEETQPATLPGQEYHSQRFSARAELLANPHHRVIMRLSHYL